MSIFTESGDWIGTCGRKERRQSDYVRLVVAGIWCLEKCTARSLVIAEPQKKVPTSDSSTWHLLAGLVKVFEVHFTWETSLQSKKRM
ncbi:hypothetical protein H6P81_007937 [Aristolochia fimbriata]|uniref:Uncharacterized protein n=1 Tax=Aristolochia fimbriata TaxID=158543 RepID=A0AAV7F1V3_ARIFI|nr:hypothetical protein H6P81_007937 [Aristolochia fimbriata]